MLRPIGHTPLNPHHTGSQGQQPMGMLDIEGLASGDMDLKGLKGLPAGEL